MYKFIFTILISTVCLSACSEQPATESSPPAVEEKAFNEIYTQEEINQAYSVGRGKNNRVFFLEKCTKGVAVKTQLDPSFYQDAYTCTGKPGDHEGKYAAGYSTIVMIFHIVDGKLIGEWQE